MKKKLLFLLFLATTLFFGSCTKEYLSEAPLPRGSDVANTKAGLWECDYAKCLICGLCIRPDCQYCQQVCMCSQCATARCPICKLCISKEAYGNITLCGEFCMACYCQFEPQREELSCFLSAMHYVSQFYHMDLTIEDIRRKFVSDNESFPGMYAYQAEGMMRDVFGGRNYNVMPNEDQNKDYMRTILDRGFIIITNYPVNTEHGMYAHAVVVVGYVDMGDFIAYLCLDPGDGKYYIKYEEDLNWNSKNKFMVAY